MTTAGSSAPQSGKMRGRGLDALFESAPTPDATPSEIDPELAAMLAEEVRAGAPPIESLSAIQAPELIETGASRSIGAGDVRTVTAGPLPAGPAPMPALDEAIDVPSPIADAPIVSAVEPTAPLPLEPSPVTPPTPAPVAPAPEPAPTGPAVVTTQPAAPVGDAGAQPPAQPAQPAPQPTRIGAVIIDTGTPAATGEAIAGVGPAGELILAEPAIPGQRDVMPPGPGVRPAQQPLPMPQQFADDQKTIIINRLNNVFEAGWQKALHSQIDDLYKQVATEFSSPPANADRMLTMLQEARQILIESPENYVSAEYRLMQVRSTVSRMAESRRQGSRYGPRILVYEIAWLALFLVGLVFATSVTSLLTRTVNLTGATANDVFPFWNTLMWGGIGGIVGALYALWWHVSDQQDFDRHFTMWYLVQPIMGLVLGGIVFLLLTGGFLLLQIQPTDANAGARLLPYLTAVLAGFRQNFIYSQFDRLISLFAPPSNQK